MENSFQTSFIPKKPIISSGVSGKEPINFFSIITIFLLIVSILASAGLYAYKLYLTKQKESISSSLLIARDSFEKDTINELDLFYKRTESAKKILSNHIVLSPLFSLLEDITIPQVQYKSFDQSIDEKGGFFTVKMTGIASDYRAIVLQADVFNSEKSSSLKNVLFSNLTKDKNNNISFNLEFDVSPDFFSYEKNSLSEEPTPLSVESEKVTQ